MAAYTIDQNDPSYLKLIERLIQLEQAFTVGFAKNANADLDAILKIFERLNVKLEVDHKSEREVLDWVVNPSILGTYGFIKGGTAAAVVGGSLHFAGLMTNLVEVAPDIADALTGIPIGQLVRTGAAAGAAVGIVLGLSATHWRVLIRAKNDGSAEVVFAKS